MEAFIAGVPSWAITTLLVTVAVLVRSIVSLHPYSGTRAQVGWFYVSLAVVLNEPRRLRNPAHAWRLRSAAALDGNHGQPSARAMVRQKNWLFRRATQPVGMAAAACRAASGTGTTCSTGALTTRR